MLLGPDPWPQVDGLCEDIGPIFSTVTVLLDNTILYSLLRMEPAKLDALFAFWTACLRKDLPDLAAHFDELGLGPPMYVVDWLFTCYCKVLSPDVAVWVWDRLILHPDGDLYLVKAGLGLLRTLRSRCLAGDLADCMQLLHVAHPADPGDTAAAEEIHKAIEKAKVSSSEFERFRQRLEAVEELVGSPRPDAEAAAQPEPEAGAVRSVVTFSEPTPIGMNVKAGGGVSWVEPGSAAEEAGVAVGDHVVSVNEAPVEASCGETELQTMLGPRPVRVCFRRAGGGAAEEEWHLEERLGEAASKFSKWGSRLGKRVAEEAATLTSAAIAAAHNGDEFERRCPTSDVEGGALPDKLGLDLGRQSSGTIRVAKVVSGSYAEREWALEAGMQLLSVQGRSVSGLDFDEMMRIVREERPLVLRFRTKA